jgi:predicted membrane protein
LFFAYYFFSHSIALFIRSVSFLVLFKNHFRALYFCFITGLLLSFYIFFVFRACYQRIFTRPKQKTKKLTTKKRPKINHTPISKIEINSEPEDDNEKTDTSSDKEIDSKAGIKTELKCGPSASKE